jgi:type IV pilus assembly protein PilZ
MNDRASPRIATPAGTPPAAGVPAAAASGAAAVAAPSAARPSVIQLVFREKGALYAAYIPLLTDGGLFVPTTREYKLGEDIYLLLSLPDDPQRYPVAGKVAWITPSNASGGRTQGVGVRFPADEKTRGLKLKIEELLGTSISSSKPTQTL